VEETERLGECVKEGLSLEGEAEVEGEEEEVLLLLGLLELVGQTELVGLKVGNWGVPEGELVG